ncbi:MAG: hotdog domain-containing protein [Lautropia sp.]|nr:hotdog domain-containing protein [Lautropia sp.]
MSNRPDQNMTRTANPATELPPGRSPVLAVVPMPPDSNPHGHVFGGWIMSQMDIAGAVAAVQRARCRVSTVAINTLTFLAPIRVGERTLFYAEVVRVGTTSVTTRVEAYTHHNLMQPSSITKVSEGLITYVAMDEYDQPQPVDRHP